MFGMFGITLLKNLNLGSKSTTESLITLMKLQNFASVEQYQRVEPLSQTMRRYNQYHWFNVNYDNNLSFFVYLSTYNLPRVALSRYALSSEARLGAVSRVRALSESVSRGRCGVTSRECDTISVRQTCLEYFLCRT